MRTEAAAPNAATCPLSKPAEAEEALGEKFGVSCRAASTPDELAIHFRIRQDVFVREQRFFTASDKNERDCDSHTVHVLALWGNVAAGAVRLYPLGERNRWKGDRLAVVRGFRKHGLGGPLVRFAVQTAGERGGELMVANIQLQTSLSSNASGGTGWGSLTNMSATPINRWASISGGRCAALRGSRTACLEAW